MRILSPATSRFPTAHRCQARGAARPLLLGLVCFVLGAGLSAYWFSRPQPQGPPPEAIAPLPQSLKSVLDQQTAPVEIRFFAALDPATIPDATRAYAKRLEDLLGQFQAQSNGKLKVICQDSAAATNADAALAAGIKPFNGSSGQDSFLGLCAILNGHKAALPELSSDWEAAFPSDLTRLIARLSEENAAATPVAPAIDPAATEEVKKIIPNPSAVTVEEGNQMLRAMALKDFAAAAAEMKAQITEAEKKVTDAEASGSEADQQAAVKALQQVQAEQTEKLKAIAAKSKSEVDAFARLKAAGHE